MVYVLMLENTKTHEDYEALITALDWPVDEGEWGVSPEAEAGQNAMMNLMGIG